MRLWWKGVNDDAEAIVKRVAGTGVLFVIVRLALYWKSGEPPWGRVVLTVPEIAWVVFFIIIGWMLVSMASAAVRVNRNEKSTGYWEKNKRIYFESQHVFTRQEFFWNERSKICFVIVLH